MNFLKFGYVVLQIHKFFKTKALKSLYAAYTKQNVGSIEPFQDITKTVEK